MSLVSYSNRSNAGCASSSSLSSSGSRSTFLLSRVYNHCRCNICTNTIRHNIEKSIIEPLEPLMIPTLNIGYGWWNVRLPNKLYEPVAQFPGAEVIRVDEDTMRYFDEKMVINWCPGLSRLHPIQTTGDGNCLMHAVILASCGIQDCGIVLRRLVYVALVEATANTFRERWRTERERLNESIPGGLQLTPSEWDQEWNLVVSSAEDFKKTSSSYEFLEEMHVFVVANVIRRPIIILGESTVRSPLVGDSIEHNNFVGIYLPLLWRPDLCDPNPIVLCFLMNHFQPLVTRYSFKTDPKEILAIPLVTSRLEPLHIHFLLKKEEERAHSILQNYLYTSEVKQSFDDNKTYSDILVAEICFDFTYYNWEHDDYVYLTQDVRSRQEVQKISSVPSGSSANYVLPSCGVGDHRLALPKVEELPTGLSVESRIESRPGSGVRKEKVTEKESSNAEIFTKITKFRSEDSSLEHVEVPRRNLNRNANAQSEHQRFRDGTTHDDNPVTTQEKTQRALEPMTKISDGSSKIGQRKKLSDISDIDINYIKEKFKGKTPVYCRNLLMLGKYCSETNCHNFCDESESYCKNHHKTIKADVVNATKCSHDDCEHPGLVNYDRQCRKCFVKEGVLVDLRNGNKERKNEQSEELGDNLKQNVNNPWLPTQKQCHEESQTTYQQDVLTPDSYEGHDEDEVAFESVCGFSQDLTKHKTSKVRSQTVRKQEQVLFNLSIRLDKETVQNKSLLCETERSLKPKGFLAKNCLERKNEQEMNKPVGDARDENLLMENKSLTSTEPINLSIKYSVCEDSGSSVRQQTGHCDSADQTSEVVVASEDVVSKSNSCLLSIDPDTAEPALPMSEDSGNGLHQLFTSFSHLVTSRVESNDKDQDLSKVQSTSCNYNDKDDVRISNQVSFSELLEENAGEETGKIVSCKTFTTQENLPACIIEDCRSPARLSELGLCFNCYSQQLEANVADFGGNYTTRQTPAIGAVESHPSAGLNQLTAKKCLNPICDLFGDPIYYGYCSKCQPESELSSDYPYFIGNHHKINSVSAAYAQ